MESLETSNPLQTQVGGNHYKDFKIQPIEYIHANGFDFISSNIIKYASRHRYKNKDEDVKKVIHYALLSLTLDYGYNDEAILKTLKSFTNGQI